MKVTEKEHWSLIHAPSTIKRCDNRDCRVQSYKGFEWWLENIIVNYPHATVYQYALKTPDGEIKHKMDIYDCYSLITKQQD